MIVKIKGKEFEVEDQPADFWGWVQEGRYDREWDVLDRYLKPEHTFVDLGAWVGSHSLYASTIATRVLAVEPDPVAFSILTGNTQKNGKILRAQIAISDHNGTVTLGSGFLGASTTRLNRDGGGGVGPWEEGHQFDIHCVTLREFLEGLPQPIFLKVDIEGAEELVLKDEEWFRENRPTVYLETHPWWWRDVPGTWERVWKLEKILGGVNQLNKNSFVFGPRV